MMTITMFRDFWLKVLAVGLSVVLWLFVAGDPIAERGLRVPLVFENFPDAVEIVGNPPETVEVRLRGASGTLRRLQFGEVMAIIDLRDERTGNRMFDMNVGRVQVPRGVQVTQVTPSSVSLILEELGPPRSTPVMPRVEGTPAPGFVVGRVSTDPAMVEVVGPRSRLGRLTGAVTELIDVTGATTTIERTVTIGVSDPYLRLSTPRQAQVTVEITQALVERRGADVPVRIRNSALDMTPAIVPPTVSVYGSPDQMAAFEHDVVKAWVDVADLPSGSCNLAVVVEPKRVFDVAQIEPPMVQVVIQ